MNSDKIVKLLEYIAKRYDVVLSERSMCTRLYPTDRFIYVQGDSLGEIIERICKKLARFSVEQFKEGLEEILNEQIHN